MSSNLYKQFMRQDYRQLDSSPEEYFHRGMSYYSALHIIRARHPWGDNLRSYNTDDLQDVTIKKWTIVNWSLKELSIILILKDNSCIRVSSEAYSEWALLDGDETELQNRPPYMGFLMVVHRTENECTLVQ